MCSQDARNSQRAVYTPDAPPRENSMNGKPPSDAKYLLVIFIALMLALLLFSLVPDLFK